MTYEHLWNKTTPTPRTFECRCCGDTVNVTETSDHRTVYCSAYCEREYWRHRSRYDRKKKIDQGHVTYLSAEHAENRREMGFEA